MKWVVLLFLVVVNAGVWYQLYSLNQKMQYYAGIIEQAKVIAAGSVVEKSILVKDTVKGVVGSVRDAWQSLKSKQPDE